MAKILIVDDKESNLLALETVLRSLDVELIRALTGNDALRATLNHEFALAILDVQMPVMDGYELAALLRSDSRTRNIPIVFLSAVYSEEPYIFRGYESGAVDFITKPFNPEVLLSKVRIFLELNEQKSELVKQKARLESLVSQLEDQIEARRQAEDDLRTAHAELEQRVEARTAELITANRTLERQKELLQTIIDHIPVMLCCFDSVGHLHLVNPEFERLMGWSVEEARKGEVMVECTPVAEPPGELWRCMEKGTPEWRDFVAKTRAGDHLESSWSKVRLTDGSQIGIGIDLRERRRVEKALQEQSRLSEAFFKHTITPIVFLDKDFNFIRVNEAYARACQRDVAVFPGQNLFEFYPSDAKPNFEQVVATKETFQAFAWPFVFPDHPEWGVTYWDWALVPILDPSGEVEFLILSLNDVTDRKLAEVSLCESEEKFRLIAETVEDVFWMSTPGLRQMLYINSAYEKIWGRTRESLYQSPGSFFEAVHPADLERVLSCVQDQGRGFYECDYRIVKPDTSVRWIYDRGFPIRDEQGNLRLMVGVATDVTERKQTEEALRESEKQLRYLSSRLLSAQEDERKRISTELHDSIGSSLSAIKFGLENALNKMRQDTDAAGALLENLVTISMNTIEDARRIYTDLRPSVLDDLGIVATIGWFSRQFQSIHPDIRIDKEVLLEESDVPEPLRIVLFRILQEAFHNIAKHSQAPVVDLSLAKMDGAIHLVIKDHGVGFDLDRARLAENAGKGLGLTTMKERTELSGGTFAVESSMGKGTCIRATWPGQR
jgi:PAS domain S-box-containing protein